MISGARHTNLKVLLGFTPSLQRSKCDASCVVIDEVIGIMEIRAEVGVNVGDGNRKDGESRVESASSDA